MSGGFALLAGGMPADDLVDAMLELEVEESADGPGAVALVLPVTAGAGELRWTDDARLGPLAGLSVVARAGEGADACIFDGYVLSHALSLDAAGADSRLRIWGQDASWMMNRAERAREWNGLDDATIAASIFAEYQIVPAPSNSEDFSPAHPETGHTLMQRGTDAQFLADLARRSGKLFRVACADSPLLRTGVFGQPRLDGEPVATLTAAGDDANIEEVELSWDVMRPTAASAGQAMLDGSGAVQANAGESGLALMDARGLADFAGSPTEILWSATVDDSGELDARARGALGATGWFLRCRGKTEASLLGAVLRAGSVVALAAAGSLYSGNWLVWRVRHHLTGEQHEMRFELVRNAIGPAPAPANLFGGLM